MSILAQHVRLEPLLQVTGITEEILRDRLTSFQYEDTTKEPPEITLKFSDADRYLFDPEHLMLGLTLRVTWGYPDAFVIRDVILRGISGLGLANQPSETHYVGRPYLVDKAHRVSGRADLSLPPFNDTTISGAVREVARALGFPEDNLSIQDTETVMESIAFREDETAAQFLTRMARQAGYFWDVRSAGEQSIFHFHAQDYQTTVAPVSIVAFGGPDLLSWEVEGDATLPIASLVRAKGVDTGKRLVLTAASDDGSVPAAVFEVTDSQAATAPQVDAAGNAAQTAAAAVVPNEARRNLYAAETIPSADITHKGVLRARRRFLERARNKWKLKMQLVGNPAIMAKRALQLDGFPALATGMWYVRGVQHTIDARGYITEILEASRRDPVAAAATGMADFYFQFYEGSGDVPPSIAEVHGQ